MPRKKSPRAVETPGLRHHRRQQPEPQDFQVDVSNSLKLRSLAPKDCLFVSESGIKTRSDIEKLEANGTSAVLRGREYHASRGQKSHAGHAERSLKRL